jgi:hypothetical protein
MTYKFNKKYFFLSLLLFTIEVCIALFFHNRFIRPLFGDFLVVILLYCMLKSVFSISVKTAAISVLIFSFLVEIMQYFQLVKILGLQDNKLACIVIGTSFAWEDLVAYSLGILTVYLVEKKGNS